METAPAALRNHPAKCQIGDAMREGSPLDHGGVFSGPGPVQFIVKRDIPFGGLELGPEPDRAMPVEKFVFERAVIFNEELGRGTLRVWKRIS